MQVMGRCDSGQFAEFIREVRLIIKSIYDSDVSPIDRGCLSNMAQRALETLYTPVVFWRQADRSGEFVNQMLVAPGDFVGDASDASFTFLQTLNGQLDSRVGR